MPVQTLYCDVDLTLVDSEGRLYPNVQDVLVQWRRMYKTLVCWSHTGGDYAKKTCEKAGIDHFFDLFLDKPDVIVDDNPKLFLTYANVLEVIDPNLWWKEAMSHLYNNPRRKEC